MTSTIATPSTSHRTAAAFEQYVSGRRSLVPGAVFFLESDEHLDEVRLICDDADVIIAPASDIALPEGVIGYTGAFHEPGDEMTLDGRHSFELQDYLAAPFISIVGLTVVRQGSTEGLDAFLQDADSARGAGAFVDQLLSSAVLLDSRASFAGDADAALVRVHVTASGEYRDGPDGLLLGVVGDLRRELEDAAGRVGAGRAFARIVDGAEFEDALASRPWLGRYVAALDLLRQWEGGRAHLAISGFGGHLVRAIDEGAVGAPVSAHSPFLVTASGGDFVLVEPSTRRRFRLGVDAARGAECLIATGDDALAAELLATEIGGTAASAAAAIAAIAARFARVGVDLTAVVGTAA